MPALHGGFPVLSGSSLSRLRSSCRTGLVVSMSTLLLTLSAPLTAIAQAPGTGCEETRNPAASPSQASTQGTSANQFTTVASWVANATTTAESVLGSLVPQLLAYFTPVPWPQIHDRAKQARVPILMYHDILPEKQVFFDVTPEEFEAHLQLIQKNGLTPITMQQLVMHLRTGAPLPKKPVLLTFDDGYSGHYDYVYPLLKKYGYPGVFSIYPSKVGKKIGRSSLTWDQLREMVKDPLVTIASHSVTHPPDLRALPEAKLRDEIFESKRVLETELGIPIPYFTYPAGFYDKRILKLVEEAGYEAALTMNDLDERFAGQSNGLLEISRIGQSRTPEVITQAWGGPEIPGWSVGFNFKSQVSMEKPTVNGIPIILITGGKPVTIHHTTRAQVPEILKNTPAIAAVDGGFFNLEFLDSNVMVGPVMSRSHNRFIPGNRGEIPLIQNRPLVMISDRAVRFVPFDYMKHNSLEGVQAEMPDVTDAFVGAAWLVKNSEPQPAASFGKLFDFDAARHRAFWGINRAGEPVIGVSEEPVGSVDLGKILAKAGFRDAVMLDSGASTSLAYKGESLVGYEPRPVPHVVALIPPEVETAAACTIVARK
ncbi:MAG: polysaccharide deacetylase family protein [Leptolyngbyaceae cyanobacterium bins.59]|nr:polysaccharide deacetylase family protein [Leptolyngbyaceae cyanobacterium bins.59]